MFAVDASFLGRPLLCGADHFCCCCCCCCPWRPRYQLPFPFSFLSPSASFPFFIAVFGLSLAFFCTVFSTVQLLQSNEPAIKLYELCSFSAPSSTDNGPNEGISARIADPAALPAFSPFVIQTFAAGGHCGWPGYISLAGGIPWLPSFWCPSFLSPSLSFLCPVCNCAVYCNVVVIIIQSNRLFRLCCSIAVLSVCLCSQFAVEWGGRELFFFATTTTMIVFALICHCVCVFQGSECSRGASPNNSVFFFYILPNKWTVFFLFLFSFSISLHTLVFPFLGILSFSLCMDNLLLLMILVLLFLLSLSLFFPLLATPVNRRSKTRKNCSFF